MCNDICVTKEDREQLYGTCEENTCYPKSNPCGNKCAHGWKLDGKDCIQIQDTTTTTTPSACFIGWTQYKDSCYRYLNETMRWKNAEKYCKLQSIEGLYAKLEFIINDVSRVSKLLKEILGYKVHLASVQSLEENKFILGLVDGKQSFWLGGYRPVWTNLKDWRWSDGSAWSYESPWAPEEPNNHLGRQPYLNGNNVQGEIGNWADGYVDDKNPFVCKYSL